MLILLPNDGNSVKTVARDMQHSQLNQIVNDLRPIEIILEIPKFEIEYTGNLVEILKSVSVIYCVLFNKLSQYIKHFS